MKKFLSILAIATVTVATIVITQGAAHNIRRCRMDHCLKTRVTTNRIFSFDSYQLRRQLERRARIRRNSGNKFTFWNNYKRQIAKPFVKQNYATYRATHSSLFPRNNNTLTQPHKIAVRETEYHQNYKWDSLKKNETIAQHNRDNFVMETGNGFTVKMPKSFIKTSEGKFYDAARDLTVNMAKDNLTNCGGLSFQLCASKKNAKSRENMENVKNLDQNFRLRQVKVGGETVMFPTYQESFEYNDQVYYSYTNMNPFTGNIVTMYGLAPATNKFAAGNLMETLFRNIQL